MAVFVCFRKTKKEMIDQKISVNNKQKIDILKHRHRFTGPLLVPYHISELTVDCLTQRLCSRRRLFLSSPCFTLQPCCTQSILLQWSCKSELTHLPPWCKSTSKLASAQPVSRIPYIFGGPLLVAKLTVSHSHSK